MALRALKDSYTNSHNHWIREYETGKLTWANLITKLTCISNGEKIAPSSVRINIDKAKNSRAGAGAGAGESGNKCPHPGCEATLYKNMVYHEKCGKHHPKGSDCWWCEPYKAPDSWKYKVIRIEKLKAPLLTIIAAVVYNSARLLYPPIKGTLMLLNYTNIGIASI